MDNFRGMFKKYWKGTPPKDVVELMVVHTIIHEFCHFITAHRGWSNYHNHPDQWMKALEMLKHYISERVGTLEDEIDNERVAMNIFKDYVFDYFLGDRMRTILGSPADTYFRKKNPEYKLAMETLEILYYVNGNTIDFHKYEDPEHTIKLNYDHVMDLIKGQTKIGKNEGLPVCLEV